MHSIEPLVVSDVEVQAIADEILEQSVLTGKALHPETLNCTKSGAVLHR